MSSSGAARVLPLIGRETELARLQGLIHPERTTGDSLVLLGEAGLGKSTLLDVAAARAAVAGWTVLRARGGRSETELAFAGLHQLVHGELTRADDLPAAQRSVLLSALGIEFDESQATPLRLGVALLSLLSAVAAEAPLLLVVDDCQWTDAASLDVLAFLVRRAIDEPIVLLAGARGTVPPRSLVPLPRLVLEPLTFRTSARLLDVVDPQLKGPDRQAVLAQAAGNPLALLELSRALASSPAAVRRWEAAPLPLTDRLHEVYGASLAELPEATARALLVAAVADTGDPAVLRLATAGVTAEEWQPAEAAGLVVVDDVVRFRHPLVRAATYLSASHSNRRQAHRLVADLLVDYPDRRAWHLAGTSLPPDENVAAELEASAQHSLRRGAYLEASRALERAADFSQSRADRARRLVAATDAALGAGDAGGVRVLAARAHDETEDPQLRRQIARLEANALSTTLDHHAARQALRRSIRLSLEDEPMESLASLTTAALVANFTGDESARTEVVALAAEVVQALAGTPFETLPVVVAALLWVDAALAPVDHHTDLAAVTGSLADAPETDADGDIAMLVGAAALVLDETVVGSRLLTVAADRARLRRGAQVSAATLTGLAWALVERGRLDEALSITDEALQIAIAGQQQMFVVNAEAAEATVAAIRGDIDVAQARISSVLATLDTDATAGVAGRIRYAAGLTAMGDGDFHRAFLVLSQLFGPDGAPAHYQRSWYALPDLAAAGVRSGSAAQARAVVDGALSRLSGPLRPRLRRQVDRALALLSDSDDAEPLFVSAASGNDAQVPFELAQARLDYGEWLRRRRRIVEARAQLEFARQDFERLGAAPWVERTNAELHAAGSAQVARSSETFGQLTPQQQRIARLAASGLTNREIGERLFLSPRTVSTHLYAIFPVLQITARAQLHEVVPPELG